MTPVVAGQSAKISVTDFGPIARADVELRPLTIFVGPSNTGKSYLATLVFALSQFFSESLHPWDASSRMEWVRLLEAWTDPEREAFVKWLHEMTEAQQLPDSVAQAVRRAIEPMLPFRNPFESHLKKCFGVENLQELVRHHTKKPAAVRVSNPCPESAATLDVSLGAKESRLRCALPAGMDIGLPPGWSFGPDSPRRDLGEGGLSLLVPALQGMAIATLRVRFPSLTRTPHYLPADRTGVMHTHRMVVSAALDRAMQRGIHRDATEPELSGTLGDFLMKLVNIIGGVGEFKEASERMQEDILSGEVEADSLPGLKYPSFYYRPASWNRGRIPLTRASAMVSELAPVVLYLRHVVKNGDLLVIEEPEAHLHTEAQAEFAAHIARLVNSGLNVIVTTHSVWMLEQFANVALLSRQDRRKRSEFESGHRYLAGSALHPDQIGAWQFNPKTRPAGAVVTEIPFGTDATVLPDDVVDAGLRLRNDWAELDSALQPEHA